MGFLIKNWSINLVMHQHLDTFTTAFTTANIRWYEPIQTELTAVETRLRTLSFDHHDLLTTATDHLFSAGGKRIRPAISLLTSGIFNADYDHTVSLAAGVEMLHTATLVHDDLVDGSLLRRGLPTLNADWSPETTVLVGDYLFARAASLVAETENVKIMNQFTNTLMVILNGEISQQFSRWQINRQEYFERIYAKTAALFVLATRAAALLGNAEKTHLQVLVEFGRSIGVAFQIIDDILDFTGTAEQIGKPIGSDLRQGLFTLPVILYSEAHPNDPDLRKLLVAKDGDHHAVSRLISSVRKSDAIEVSLCEARSLIAQGQSSLEKIPYSTYVESLSALAESVVERKL